MSSNDYRLSVKRYIVFKRIFAHKGNEDFLRNFLSSLLKISIDSIEILHDIHLEKDNEEDKLGIIDVRAIVNENKIINIEVQIKNNKNIVPRSTFYGAKLISNELVKNEVYQELKPVIVICILNYENFPYEEYINETEIVLKEHKEYIVNDYMKVINKIMGTTYKPFEFYGDSNAENIIVAMGSVSDTIKLVVDKENKIIKLFDPPFEKSVINPGYIKSYPPGIRENGGQYAHGSCWMLIAECILGFGDKAEELLQILNPIEHSKNREEAKIFKLEPYILEADLYSNEDLIGRGGWNWYTGSSSWFYKAGIEYILGLKINKRSFKHFPLYTKRMGGILYQI